MLSHSSCFLYLKRSKGTQTKTATSLCLRLCDPHRVGLSPYGAKRVPCAFRFNVIGIRVVIRVDIYQERDQSK